MQVHPYSPLFSEALVGEFETFRKNSQENSPLKIRGPEAHDSRNDCVRIENNFVEKRPLA